MILLKLFLVFSKIGIFNFGGGYAMLSFIQNEVVNKNGWISESEFTDIIAISQMTPGPIGINAATYVGYTSVINDPYMQDLFASSPTLLSAMGVLGSVIATLSVLWLPFMLMIAISKFILKHKNDLISRTIFSFLRPAIIGLIAAASLSLMTSANFGNIKDSPLQFAISILIFIIVFLGTRHYKWNLIYTICMSGVAGFLIYGLPLL